MTQEFESKNSELKVFPLSDFPFSEFYNKTKFIFSFPYFSRNYAKEFHIFQDSFKPKLEINQSTIAHFTRLWFRNYFINFDLSLNRGNTAGFVFEDSFPFKEKDILFVGAAPILENQISWIRENQDRFFILSSDTACYTLIANRIRPDFILSIDAGRGTIFHFKDIPSDIPIITWLGANTHIFRLPNPVYLYLSTYPLDQVLHSILFSGREFMIKNPSLNVAGLAKAIGETFFAKRLIFSGMSFKIQSAKTHARGTGYENFNLPRVNRYYPMEAYIPKAYQKEISPKNKAALYHLMESKSLQILKPELISDIELGTAIYKTKSLSLKVSPNLKEKFKKFLLNPNIQKEVLTETGIELTVFNKMSKLMI